MYRVVEPFELIKNIVDERRAESPAPDTVTVEDRDMSRVDVVSIIAVAVCLLGIAFVLAYGFAAFLHSV
jgi:hypothetical protein